MSWTNWGFDGTINEAQWAQMAGLLGNGYVAAGNGDCVVTAVAGARSVSVAAGTLYGDGVVSVNSAPETVAMTTPINGQWYVIALRRTWATNTAALVAIAGATTTTTTPTAPPTSFPTLNTNVGVLTDQPIAWAWCNSANTTVVIYDIRLRAVKSMPPVVANSTERDAKFMSPYQGLQVWRDDLGVVETYYGLYNSSTNPGGRNSAGWYISNRSSGLMPLKPTSVDKSGGTATVTPLGAVTFSGVASISLNGVFSSAYKNYRIIGSFGTATASALLQFRLRTAGTNNTDSWYAGGGYGTNLSGGGNDPTQNGNNLNVGFVYNTTNNATRFSMDMSSPAETVITTFTEHDTYYDGSAVYGRWHNGMHYSFTSYDGFSILFSAGAGAGEIQVFGYND